MNQRMAVPREVQLGAAPPRWLRSALREVESIAVGRAEYERIRALCEVSPIAAHFRERRFELALTQQEVAKAARTSHIAVSRLEEGTRIPQLPILQRIAGVLDEELLVCFQRTVDGEIERELLRP
jgi:DNA-binding XRE family transcriptional regulator